MGVTGILEATAQLLAMNDNFIPPTLNFSGPRPGCALDYVPNEARPKKYDAFISANYAFGGNNAAVVVTRWDSPVPPRAKKSTNASSSPASEWSRRWDWAFRKRWRCFATQAVGLTPVAAFPLPARTRAIGGTSRALQSRRGGPPD